MTTRPTIHTAIRYSDGRAFGAPHARPRVDRPAYSDATIAIAMRAVNRRPLTVDEIEQLGIGFAQLVEDLDAERNAHQVTALLVDVPDEDPDAFEIDPDPTDSVDVSIVDMPPDSPPEELRHG